MTAQANVRDINQSLMLFALYYTTVIVTLWLRFSDGATGHQTIAERPRTRIKWLINTGNVAGRWSPPKWTKRINGTTDSNHAQCRTAMLTPNTITRMQMIRGGTAAVLVMPTGDGSYRCCGNGTPYRYSLGVVELKHGTNNLYPAIQPFPDWKLFEEPNASRNQEHEMSLVSEADPSADYPQILANESTNKGLEDNDTEVHTASLGGGTTKPHNDVNEGHHQPRIVNVVDAFLDDRGQLLWVLDTGGVGEDACYGNTMSSDGDRSSETDNQPPPKFFAVDVHTNKILSFVSLSQVWKPGVSCFQYIVALYPDTNDGESSTNNMAGCQDWPLVFVGDAGTNRMIVYLHSKDRFTEIMLPAEEEKDLYQNIRGGGSGDNNANSNGGKPRPRYRKWTSPPIRDILYAVALYPKPGQSRLMVTYHGCREIYTLQLQLSTVNLGTSLATSNSSLIPPEPVTSMLTLLGRKPCRMVILGTDRRRTDSSGSNANDFAGGGTTLFFRIENTNDIWSWDTSSLTRNIRGSMLFIDEREFQLVRLGRTCRVPVAVSAAPMAAAAGTHENDEISDHHTEKHNVASQNIQQVLWTLETNFVDHFAGTSDQMGVNAKLQPIEIPLYIGNQNSSFSYSGGKKLRLPPLRVQPLNDIKEMSTKRFRLRNRGFPHR